MRVKVKRDLKHMFMNYELPKDTVVEVSHFAEGFYQIKAPDEFAGYTIHRNDFEPIEDEMSVYGIDCRSGKCEM